MYITIINDCADTNAAGRQSTRVSALFGITPTLVGLEGTLNDAAQLEASGNIIDILDAGGNHEGVILVNVAPRNGQEKRWGNGTPFCYFRIGKTLLVTTVSGLTLTLPKKLGLLTDVHVFDLPATVGKMYEAGIVTSDEHDRIIASQFRSMDFMPRVAHCIMQGGETVTTPFDLSHIPAVTPHVWTIDNFGNAKTTLLGSELAGLVEMKTAWGTLPIVRSLKDVSDGSAAITIGSSGFGNARFAEIVVMGASASTALGIQKGDAV